MSQKTVLIPELGEITLYKRRGTRHIRLSVNAKGRVRVSLPAWTPYAAGINFALSKQSWLRKQLDGRQVLKFSNGTKIGKSHRLEIIFDPTLKTANSRMPANQVRVITPWPVESAKTQAKIKEACAKALKKEAEILLPQRLDYLAKKYGYKYKRLRIRSLTSRWGSCSSDGTITLSYYLVQLPWHHIDYVLLHELVHTVHMNHSPSFWQTFDKHLAGAKQIKKQINQYKPEVWPVAI